MGLFTRSPAPPSWAQPLFDRKGWDAFRAELARTVTQLDPQAVIDDANGNVELTLGGDGMRLPVKEVARACVGGDASTVLADWSAFVREQVEANRPPATFDDALPHLRMQLYNDATRTPLAIEAAKDLWYAPVIDTPVAMLPIREPLLERWKVTLDEVIEEAFVSMDELPEPSFDGTHAPILVAHGDEYLAALAWCRIKTLIGDTPHGALVTYPTRESTLFLPLWEMPSDVALRRTVLATDKLHAGSESSVSRELYWCTPELELVLATPIRAKEGMIFLLPPGLEELMQAAVKS